MDTIMHFLAWTAILCVAIFVMFWFMVLYYWVFEGF